MTRLRPRTTVEIRRERKHSRCRTQGRSRHKTRPHRSRDRRVGHRATLTVHNVAPTATIVGAPASTPKQPITLIGQFPPTPARWNTFSYAWAVTKNGNS